MTTEIRATGPGEMREAAGVLSSSLLFPVPSNDEWTQREQSWLDADSLTAWDGDRCVAHVGAFRLDTVVPGGERLTTSGVTRVGVLPTHTRRGLLTTMMQRLLRDAHEAGTALASLRASEAVIYQRFGFEVAAEAAGVKVVPDRAGEIRDPAPGAMRLLRPTEILDVVPELYARCARRRVGSVSRPAFFWDRIVGDAVTSKKAAFVAVHEDPAGVADGYVVYDVRWAEGSDGPETGTGEIRELFAGDDAVERALWHYICDIDLVREWRADNRPIDEPVRFAMRDTRAYRMDERWDEQWLRILDVDAALRARRYGQSRGAVVIDIHDELFDANSSTWRIDADGAERTSGDPDLTVPIGVLSAVYLGGTSWTEMAAAGRVAVSRGAAVGEADVLFAARPAPFCGTFF